MSFVTRTKRQQCPHCQAVVSAMGHEEAVTPRPGDLTVCAYCVEVCVVTADLGLRAPTLEELEAISQNEAQLATIQNTIAMIEDFQRRRITNHKGHA